MKIFKIVEELKCTQQLLKKITLDRQALATQLQHSTVALEKAQKRLPRLKGKKVQECESLIQQLMATQTQQQIEFEQLQHTYTQTYQDELQQKIVELTAQVEEAQNKQATADVMTPKVMEFDEFVNETQQYSVQLAQECAEKWHHALYSDLDPKEKFEQFVEVEQIYRTGKDYYFQDYSDHFVLRAGLIMLKAGYLAAQHLERNEPEQIIDYLKIGLEKFNHLLAESTAVTQFHTHYTPTYSRQVCVTNNVEMTDYIHWSQMRDQHFTQYQLYDFYLKTLDQIKKENLITQQQYLAWKKIDQEACQQWEQVVDFDFEETCNSVLNSIKTLRHYKQSPQGLTPDLLAHVAASFIYTVEEIALTNVPEQHTFYSYLADVEKQELVRVFRHLIQLNNAFVGMNMKVAHSILAKREISFELKTALFNLAYNISKQVFFGLYLQHQKQITHRFNFPEFQKINQRFTQVFDDYMQQFLLGLKRNNMVSMHFALFSQAMKWHQHHFGLLGGMPLVEQKPSDGMRSKQQLTLVSLRKVILEYPQPKQLLSLILPHEKLRSSMVPNQYLYDKGLIDEILNSSYLSTYTHDQQLFLADQHYASLASYEQHMQTLATDMREMRRLLVKNYQAKDSIMPLDFDLHLAQKGFTNLHALWQWETINDTLGRICIGALGYEDMLENATKASRSAAQYLLVLRVNWDGSICSVESPWLNTLNYAHELHSHIHDLTLYLLQKFHTLFMQQYVQAAAKIKKEVSILTTENIQVHNASLLSENTQNQSTVVYDQYDVDLVVLNDALQHLEEQQGIPHSPALADAENNTDQPKIKKIQTYFNSSLKSTHFLKLLQTHFAVKVVQGKGSEVNVSRVAEGGTVYRLGHHGKVVEYNASYIRQVLKRLNIHINDWLAVLSL